MSRTLPMLDPRTTSTVFRPYAGADTPRRTVFAILGALVLCASMRSTFAAQAAARRAVMDRDTDTGGIREALARLAREANVHLILDATVRGPAPAILASGIPRADLDALASKAGLAVIDASVPGRGPSVVIVPALALPGAVGAQIALYSPRMAVPQDLLAALLKTPEVGGISDEVGSDEVVPAPSSSAQVHVELLPGARTIRIEGQPDRVASLLERAAALDVPPGGCIAQALLVDLAPDLVDQLAREATERLCPEGSGPEAILSFQGREGRLISLVPWGPPGSGRDAATLVRQELTLRLTREGVDLPVMSVCRERDGDVEHERRSLALSAYPTIDARICLSLFEARRVHGGGGPEAVGTGAPRVLVVPDGAMVLLVLSGPAPTTDLRWPGAIRQRSLPRLGRPSRDPVAVPALLLWLHLERSASRADSDHAAP